MPARLQPGWQTSHLRDASDWYPGYPGTRVPGQWEIGIALSFYRWFCENCILQHSTFRAPEA
eukprot:490575-Rhodomonas_salina.2